MSAELRQLLGGSDLRLRLAAFRIQDPTSLAPPRAAFSQSELEHEPIKWLKYVLLDRLGIESIKRASAQIRRFAVQDLAAARRWVESRLEESAAREGQIMIVVKLVAWEKGAQLTNFRLFKSAEVEQTFQRLAETDLTEYAQIWCCDSNVSGESLNLGGRLTFPVTGPGQMLEMVWFASPRMLESLSADFAFPYARAERPAGRAQFEVIETHLPKKYAAVLTSALMAADVRHVVERLDWRLPAMRRLTGLVRGAGAREICFCFKVTDGVVTVIDWDSELESVPS